MSPAPLPRLGRLAIAMLLAGCGTSSGDDASDDAGDGTTTSAEEVLGRVDVVSIRGESTRVMSLVRSDGTEVECKPETCGDGRAVFEAAPQELTRCALERDRDGLRRLFRHSSTRTLCTAEADIDNVGSVKSQIVADCAGCVAAPDDGDWGKEELPRTLSPSLPVGRRGDFGGLYPTSDQGCYVAGDGTARCFGRNTAGRLGVGRINTLDDIGLASLNGCSSTPMDSETPCTLRAFGDTVGLSGDVVQAVTRSVEDQACALLASGEVQCWGFLGGTSYELSHLGLETIYCPVDDYDECAYVGDDELPSEVVPLPIGFPVEEIACSFTGYGCVVRNSSGEVWRLGCPERNAILPIGPGHVGEELGCETSTPRTRIVLSEPATALSLEWGSSRGCALLESGAVECFGVALNDNSPDWDPLNPPLQDAATAILPLPALRANVN